MPADERRLTEPGQPDATPAGVPETLTTADVQPAAGTTGLAEPEVLAAGKDGKAHGQHSRRSLARELPILIVVALVIALVIKTFVVQAFFIPTGSMQNTLAIHDKVLVNKLVYHFRGIHRGDIIVFDGTGSWYAPPRASSSSSDPLVRAYDDTLRPVFHSIAGLFGTPAGQTDLIKRVIGLPGDHVVCCNAQGLITVNGVALHEQSYLFPGDRPGSHPVGAVPSIPGRFNITVPPGRLWVLGDDRGISDDSRGHMADPGGGTIPESKVIGRAFVIVWPPSQWKFLNIPSTFFQPGLSKATGSAAAQRAAGQVAAQDLLGARVRPSAPYAPLGAGLAVALPLTWLQRRGRRMLRARRARGVLR